LVYQAAWLTDAGSLLDADITLAEARSLADATGYSGHVSGYEAVDLMLLAMRGQETKARALADRIAAGSAGQGAGMETHTVRMMLARLDLGTGDYKSALHHLLASRHEPEVLGMVSVADVVEAAIRCDDRAAAESALAAFTPLAQASGTPLILGLLARARALLADDDAAELEYRQASSPTPGKLNTLSTTTAPLSRKPRSVPRQVITGTSALRSVCRTTTSRQGSPMSTVVRT
jgi:hypothetical protein